MLCVTAAGGVLALAVSGFTLDWTHSVERVRWEEDWAVSSTALRPVRGRIRGSGAGMEVPPGAVLRDGATLNFEADGGAMGTIREFASGAYDSTLTAGSKIAEIYGSTAISERHRHRYEVNINYREAIEQKGGLVFAGLSPDGVLPETVERPDHPWFIGVQYHPELKSRPFAPHPLFASFIGAAVVQSRLV
ncbi:MAG: DUF1850 domain-containing protein [Rhodobacterales bacterium]|nr:DUF1850 domain-containing protein [Rhodobacterales bacterium]